ncbi:MAG: glycosyltransferase family 4 protein, partial [Acidobacteriota bacterium]
VLTLRDYWPVCLHGTSWWGGSVCPGCSPKHLVGCTHEYWRWPKPVGRAMVPWSWRRLAARRAGVGAAHRVLAVSEAVRRRVGPELEEVGVEVVPNMVDASSVETAAASAATATEGMICPYLVTAGKLIRSKGFARLLADLAAAGCPWPLVVAGSGPERAELEERAGALGLTARFLGWIDHSSLLALIGRAHALLLPSAWNEPLSRLMLESMALGTPVIAWAGGGSSEVIDSGRNGWLVSERAGLVAALSALQQEAQRRPIGTAARDLAQRCFSPAAVYPLLARAYQAALETSGRGLHLEDLPSSRAAEGPETSNAVGRSVWS